MLSFAPFFFFTSHSQPSVPCSHVIRHPPASRLIPRAETRRDESTAFFRRPTPRTAPGRPAPPHHRARRSHAPARNPTPAAPRRERDARFPLSSASPLRHLDLLFVPILNSPLSQSLRPPACHARARPA